VEVWKGRRLLVSSVNVRPGRWDLLTSSVDGTGRTQTSPIRQTEKSGQMHVNMILR